MQPYRTRPRIISEVLTKAHSSEPEGGANISGFMRSCNLSHSVATGLLIDLVGAGFLLEVKNGGTTRYRISDRGAVFLEKYAQLREFVEAFGLRL